MQDYQNIQAFLDEKADLFNRKIFIKDDPISIPHSFQKKQDIEIAGLFAAIFSWGNRTTIINKSKELMALMDHSPYDFCLNHQPTDLKCLESFKHRTFNSADLLYFIEFFKHFYSSHKSLEEAFTKKSNVKRPHSKISPPSQGGDDLIANGNHIRGGVEQALINFHDHFFSLDHIPHRTQKHIATPIKGSTCKRLNMYLRWMVRNDNTGVDFGIWKKIKPADLICPIDVHVARVAKKLGLLTRKQIDWQAAVELTSYLRLLDPKDPVKYDFALFGLGVMEKF